MRNTAIEQNQSPQTEAPKRYQCRHIFTDGHRCGSPCLRSEDLCYYHHTTRRPATHPRTRRARRSTFEIPLPEDRSAIQHAIGQVLQRIAANDIDPRRAGLLLYGLQIASLNLPKPQATQPELVEETTTHPQLGTLALPAEVGRAGQRKSAVTLLMEKLLEDDEQDEQERQEPITLPTLQAAEDHATHSNPCNIRTPVVALSSACRAATHLRPLPSAIGATQRPAESSHAALKTPKHPSESSIFPSRDPNRLRLFHFHATLSKERP
jgi:hypothetical protein